MSSVLVPPESHSGASQPSHSLAGFNSCLSRALGEIQPFRVPLVEDGKLAAPTALAVDPSAGEVTQR